MKICEKCGAVCDSDFSYCQDCGALLTDDEDIPETEQFSPPAQGNPYSYNPQPQTQPQPRPQQQYQPQPQPQPQPQYMGAGIINPNMLPVEYQPVTVGQYILYNILFAIPLIGIILLFITAFGSSQKLSLKNYARSYLIMLLVPTVLIVIALILAVAFGASFGIFDYLDYLF